jgi:hypothetical protein
MNVRVAAAMVALSAGLLSACAGSSSAPEEARSPLSAAAVPAATHCTKNVHVVASVFTDWPHALLSSESNKCWSVYLVTHALGGPCKNDVVDSKPQWWQYNEISSSSANKTADRAALKACFAAVQNAGPEPHGWLDYAYGGNGDWQFAGHVPPRIGKVDLLLELYSNHTDVVSDTALTSWPATSGLLTFGAIVNYAGSTYGNGTATDAEVQNAVLSVCRRTVKYLGLYAGHGEAKINSASRIAAVANALNTCTTS